MQGKSSAIKRLFGNINRLVPFVGFLLVIAGILGLVFVQKPLDETQDLRSDAWENEVIWPQLFAENPNQDFYVNETSQISLKLHSGNIKIKKVNVVFNIISDVPEAPVITINAGSGLMAEEVEVEEVDDGFLVSLRAVPNYLEWYIQPSDVSLIKINFTPKNEGDISINFDEDNTYIETPSMAYAIDTQNTNFDIETKQSDTNDDSDQETIACNQACDSNADCAIDHRCFDTGSGNKCRLATNPSSSNCSGLPNLGLNRQCNEYCADSRECAQGFSCWWNQCRNPENIESAICADLTKEEAVVSTNSCGEQCTSNADCAINLRCYENSCRSVVNPSSLTCSATTKKTVSQIYDQTSDPKGGTDGEGVDDVDTEDEPVVPVKKGDDVIPDSERDYERVDNDKLNTRVNAVLDEDVPVDETAFDFLMSMLKDKQQSLPTTVILIGIGLLAASLIVLLVARLLNREPKHKRVNPLRADRKDDEIINIETHPVANENPEETKVFKTSRSVDIPTTATTAAPTTAAAGTTVATAAADDVPPVLDNNSPTSENIMSQEIAKNDKIKELMKKLEEQSKGQNQG